MIICPNCGAKNIDGTLFCDECVWDLSDVESVPDEGGAPEAAPVGSGFDVSLMADPASAVPLGDDAPMAEAMSAVALDDDAFGGDMPATAVPLTADPPDLDMGMEAAPADIGIAEAPADDLGFADAPADDLGFADAPEVPALDDQGFGEPALEEAPLDMEAPAMEEAPLFGEESPVAEEPVMDGGLEEFAAEEPALDMGLEEAPADLGLEEPAPDLEMGETAPAEAFGEATMPAPEESAVAPLDDAPRPSMLTREIQPKLTVVRGVKTSAEYNIYEGSNFIGRFDEQPVDIDLTDQETTTAIRVSRQHACIILENGNVYVEDNNSTNGTYVNRNKITPGERNPLRNGDYIQTGTVLFQIRY